MLQCQLPLSHFGLEKLLNDSNAMRLASQIDPDDILLDTTKTAGPQTKGQAGCSMSNASSCRLQNELAGADCRRARMPRGAPDTASPCMHFAELARTANT